MATAPLDLPALRAGEHALDPVQPGFALYGLWALFWLLMLAVGVQDQLHNPYIRWWEPLLWEGSSAVAATCWMMVQRRADRYHARYLDQPLRWFGYHLRWLPLVAVTFIGSVYAVRHGVYALLGLEYRHESWPFVLVYESFKLTLFAGLWLGIIFGFASYVQWQAQRRRLLELQKTLAEAQLSQLKAQLRPHFFFNALNTISALMHVDVARADALLARLGDLLRASLRSSEQEMTPLRDELRSLELYAQIMAERYADRVTLAWRIDADVLDIPVPALLLQPLLENAFKHGVERTTGPVQIEVIAHRHGGAAVVTVRNTGIDLAASWREGVGLRNCRERLALLCGNTASLQLIAEGNAVAARITLPLREPGA